MSNQIAAQEESARETQAQRDRDDIYADDVNTLAATFRTQFANQLTFPGDSFGLHNVLRTIAYRLTSSAAEGLAVRAVFEDHGPGAVLLALKRAYDSPEHVVSDVVEHP